MPCSDSRDRENERIIYRDGRDPADQEQISVLRSRLDLLTDLLCKAGRARRNKTEIPAEVLQWWDDHCKRDAQRGEPW